MYDNFVFRGVSCEEMGADAFWGESYTVGAQIKRGAYALPLGGSVMIGDDVPESTARQIVLVPAAGVGDTPEWRRALLTWLQGERGEMVFRQDPETVRLARFDKSGSGGRKIDAALGGIQLQMTLEPYARTRQESGASGTTSSRALTLMMPAETGVPAPLRVVLTSRGTLTAAAVSCGGKTLRLTGMSLGSGKSLEYYAGDPHGTPASLKINGQASYAPLASGQWAILKASRGDEITIETTGAEADVHVYARGWWVE